MLGTEKKRTHSLPRTRIAWIPNRTLTRDAQVWIKSFFFKGHEFGSALLCTIFRGSCLPSYWLGLWTWIESQCLEYVLVVLEALAGSSEVVLLHSSTSRAILSVSLFFSLSFSRIQAYLYRNPGDCSKRLPLVWYSLVCPLFPLSCTSPSPSTRFFLSWPPISSLITRMFHFFGVSFSDKELTCL